MIRSSSKIELIINKIKILPILINFNFEFSPSADLVENEKQNQVDEEEALYKQSKLKKRMLGMIQFIGELFNMGIVSTKIITQVRLFVMKPFILLPGFFCSMFFSHLISECCGVPIHSNIQ